MLDNYEELITIDELQEWLGIGKNAVYTLLNQHKIKCFRIGRIWKIPQKNVEDYIIRECGISPPQNTTF